MSTIIGNAKDIPLDANSGTVPDMSGALLSWFQKITFGVVTKVVENFQVVETEVDFSFMGVIQPLSNRDLILKPEGERAWTWLWVHADPSLELEVDAVVTYLGVKYRVKAKKDYSLYKYVSYELVQDWTGSSPTVTP